MIFNALLQNREKKWWLIKSFFKLELDGFSALFCTLNEWDWVADNVNQSVEGDGVYFTFYFKVNSIQEACAKCFAVQILEFEILQITWKKDIWLLVFSLSSINPAIWWFFSFFFQWFARFQISISELQSIWRKLLVLSWIYRLLIYSDN